MRILAIESSAKAASAALLDGDRLLAQSYQDCGLTHSETLMPMVEDMLKNARLDIRSTDAVAAAHGPGSFTGVRIGVSAALGLAAGLGVRAVGVSTLAAMAALVEHAGAVALCAMDARRGEVYAAAFDGEERLTDDTACPAEEFAARAAEIAKNRGKSIICIGDGAELCYNYLEGQSARLAPPHLLRQSAAGVAIAAARLLASGEPLPPLRPVYLRLSQAEREKGR